jgi:hypothetical protein
MTVLTDLRARGFYFGIGLGGKFEIEPEYLLTAEDRQALEDLLPAVTALAREGFIGEFMPPDPCHDPAVAAYYASLDPMERMGFQDTARRSAEQTGFSFRDSQRLLFFVATGRPWQGLYA